MPDGRLHMYEVGKENAGPTWRLTPKGPKINQSPEWSRISTQQNGNLSHCLVFHTSVGDLFN